MPLPEVKICVNLSCLTNAAQFYQKMEPIQDALDALNAMEEKGCTVALVYVWNSSHAKFNANDWLRDWFGVKWQLRLIIMNQPMQSFLYTDALIDRRAPRLQGCRPIDYWTFIGFGPRPANTSGVWFHDWATWRTALFCGLHIVALPAEKDVPLLD